MKSPFFPGLGDAGLHPVPQNVAFEFGEDG
jgi:hypothetical protein